MKKRKNEMILYCLLSFSVFAIAIGIGIGLDKWMLISTDILLSSKIPLLVACLK